VLCTFMVSGILHEFVSSTLCFYVAFRSQVDIQLLFRINRRITGHWFIFFTLHGFLLVIEKVSDDLQVIY